MRVGTTYNHGSRVLTKRRSGVLGLIQCYRKRNMRVRGGEEPILGQFPALARISGPGHM